MILPSNTREVCLKRVLTSRRNKVVYFLLVLFIVRAEHARKFAINLYTY